MDQRRVAELHDPSRKSGGSGYLIQNNLILTSHHVIAQLGKPGILGTSYHIRFIGDYEQGRTKWITEGCYLCWDAPDPKYDLALLKLKVDKPEFLSSHEPAICFGKLGDKTLLAEGTGFPFVQEIENRQNPEPLAGHLSRIAGLKEGQLRLQVTSPIPNSSSQWQGISGTALFVNDLLVGVIVETNKSFAEKVLWATPISFVASNKEFCKLVLDDPNGKIILQDLKQQKLNPIDWCQVSREMLTEHLQKLTTNLLTSNSVGVFYKVKDIYVPLGLVERKKQSKRKDDVSPEQGSDLYKETEITKRFEHDEFLEEVLRQKQSPKSQGKRIAIIGEPGAGKTTLLQQIANWVSSNIEQSIVIWVSLADLQGQTLEKYLYDTWLTTVVRKTGKADATDQHKNDFATQFREGRMWLLLDGLDEMSVSSNHPVTEIARQIQEGGSISQARIILTCRVNMWDGSRNQLSDKFDIYRTLDFSYPYQVETFINRWFSAIPEQGGERGQRLCTALKETGKKRIQDLVKNPLRLTLLCLHWQSREGKLPDTRAGLYQQFLDDFYQWKENQIKFEKRKQLNAKLAQLAKEAINDEKNSRFRLQYEFVSRFLGEDDDEKSLLKLALKLGWLNNIGITPNRKPVYAFYHATFEEYFAALAINDWHFFLNDFPENPSHCNANYRIFEPQWKEVILLWLGREDIPNEDKENFIKALVNFKDGCGEWSNIDRANSGFYKFQAYFLAAQGIVEFNDCSLSKDIVQQIVRYSFGYLDVKTQLQWVSWINEIVQQIGKYNFGYLNAKIPAQWESFLNVISCKALDILPTTDATHWESFLDVIWSEALINILPTNNTTKVVEELIEVIRNPQVGSYICSLAADSLGKIGVDNQTAIEELNAVVSDRQVYITTRVSAAYSLWKINPGNQTAIKELNTVISDRKAGIFTHFMAAYNLGRIGIGNQTAIKELITAICDRKRCIFTRLLMIQGLNEANIGKKANIGKEANIGNQTAIEGLIAIVRNRKAGIFTHFVAAYILGEIGVGNQTAIEGLIAIVRNRKAGIFTHFMAADSLGRIGVGNQTAIEGLIAVVRDPQVDTDTRKRVVSILGEIGVGNQTAIEELIAVVRDPQVDTDTRVSAAYSLGRIGVGNQTAIEELSVVVRDPQVDSFIRERAAYSLRKINPGNQTAIEELIAIVRDPQVDSSIRERAAYSLGEIGVGNQTAIEELSVVVRDPQVDSSIRVSAAYSLGEIGVGNQTAIEELIAVVRDPQVDSSIRVSAAYSLGKINPGNQTAIEELIAIVRDRKVNIRTREWAAYSLEKIGVGNQTAIEALSVVIRDPQVDSSIRERAVHSLGEINPGNQTGIEKLIAVIRDRKVNIRTRERTAYSLGEMMIEKDMVYVVGNLKNCLSYETYKNEFDLFSMCYKIIWVCAKKMTYPDFHHAWFKSMS